MTEKTEYQPSITEAVKSLHHRLSTWFHDFALPLWDEHGVDRSGGGYHEHLASDGNFPAPPGRGGVRRGRVVARQIYVFDVAHRQGWRSARTNPVDHGSDYLFSHFYRGAGCFHTAIRADNRKAAGPFSLYEHAFYIFALARLMPSSAQRLPVEQTALDCLSHLRFQLGRAEGGFEESEPPSLPLKANPHMHLLEAALEWIRVCTVRHRPTWVALAAEIVALCLDRFVDARTGAVREYFDFDWRSVSGGADSGQVVEPGHQFEWAWLLMHWVSGADCAAGQREACALAAARLLDIGETHGVDHRRGVAVNELWEDLTVKDAAAKLWPQTERLKAWCAALGSASNDADSAQACERIDDAGRGLLLYLTPGLVGLWRETLSADGTFETGPSKASSFYHVVCAIDVLRQTVSAHLPSVVYSTQQPTPRRV